MFRGGFGDKGMARRQLRSRPRRGSSSCYSAASTPGLASDKQRGASGTIRLRPSPVSTAPPDRTLSRQNAMGERARQMSQDPGTSVGLVEAMTPARMLGRVGWRLPRAPPAQRGAGRSHDRKPAPRARFSVVLGDMGRDDLSHNVDPHLLTPPFLMRSQPLTGPGRETLRDFAPFTARGKVTVAVDARIFYTLGAFSGQRCLILGVSWQAGWRRNRKALTS